MVRDVESDLSRRLPWLLVFRAAVATALLLITLAADLGDWPLRRASALLYGVVVGSYLVVFMLGLLLRAGYSPVILSTVHLVTVVMAGLMAVQGTGGVDSAFSFLYLLAILDGAIIGRRRIALVVASACSVAYGTQLGLQMYGVLPPASATAHNAYLSSAIVHVAAFFSMALLAGYLAELLRRAREAASTARFDLLAAEELHATVLESLPLGVVTVGADGLVRTANASAHAILEESELSGHRLPGPLRDFVLSDELTALVELPRNRRNRSISVSKSTLGHEDDGLEVVVIEDRTELRALERSFHERERLASIGELAAAIAHELRNPLAAISGSIELLASDTPSVSERERLQSIVLREIERLNRLVGDFLVYARPAPMQPMHVDVVGLSRELCEVLQQDSAWTGHSLELHAPTSLESDLDPRQVRQMLWNLLRNAVDASPPDAPVHLRVAALDSTGPGVAFEVEDHGSGIPPELVDHMFEPFKTTKRGGTGLGLAVVHRIVENHDGRIHVESGQGEGTVVRVELPGTSIPLERPGSARDADSKML